MKHLFFIKNSIIERLSSPVNSLEDADSFAKNLLNSSDISQGILYNFVNRRSYLNDIFKALNAVEQNLILVSGFQGTGKTTLVKTVALCLEEKILNFYYECSSITNLDDIFLALYGYLHKIQSKNQDSARSTPKNESIDEKLMNYLRNLKRPLLITIDGFENLMEENSGEIDSELAQFLNYILSLPTVRLVIAGKKIAASGFEINKNNILHTRLSGLDENEALQILRDNKLSCAENTLYQIFQTTRGYAESLLLFTVAANILQSPPFEIIKDYSTHKESFEEYIFRKIYISIPHSLKKIVWLLAAIRHPVKLNALKELNPVQDIEEKLKYLSSIMIITANNDAFYVKSFFKEIIYRNIPDDEKGKIHKYLHELYTDQIPKKIENRILKISRRLLHSEQYYHFICSTKFDKTHDSTNLKKLQPDLLNLSAYNLNYLPPHMAEIPILIEKSIKEDTEKKADKIKNEHADISHKFKETDLDIELSEEEKIILQEQNLAPEENENAQTLLLNKPDDNVNPENKQINLLEETRNNFLNQAEEFLKTEQYKPALDSYKKSYELTEQLQDTQTLARISREIGNIYHSLDKYDESLKYFHKALDLFTDLNDKASSNHIILDMARTCNDFYKYDKALEYYNKLIELPNSDIQEKILMEALIGVGDIYDYREEFKLALKYYNDAFEVSNKLNNPENLAELYFKMALINDDLANYDKAIEYYKKNIETSKDPEKNRYLASSYANIAAIYEETNNKNSAVSYYLKSLEVDEGLNNYEGKCRSLSKLGSIYLKQNNKEKALECLQKETRAAKLTQDNYLIASSYLSLGDFYLAEKLYEKAIKSFIMARKVIGKTISTDSKEKIDRRFRQVILETGEAVFNNIINNLKNKNG